MSMISGLLLNLLLWAVAAAVFTAAVCWAVVEWFPGGAAGRSEEPADAGPAPERPEEPRAGRGDGQVDRKAA